MRTYTRICVREEGQAVGSCPIFRKVGYNLGYKVTIPRSMPSLLMKAKSITMTGQEDEVRPSVHACVSAAACGHVGLGLPVCVCA